jgi:outer membrane protein TolC
LGSRAASTWRSPESEIRASLSALTHREAALVEVAASARLADESLELARTAFQEGAGTQVDLIEAERSARDAATAVAVATHDRDRARLDLLLATGRLPFAP